MELHGIGRGSSDCPINRKNPFLNLKGVVFRVCILQNLYPATVVVVVVINSPNIGTPRIEWNKVKC